MSTASERPVVRPVQAPGRLSREARVAWTGVYRVGQATLDRIDRQFLKEFDLSLVCAELLFLLNSSPEPLRVTDLVERVIMSQSSVTRGLNRLEDKALITRVPSTTDRRVSTFAITPAGIVSVARMRQVEERVVDEMLTGHLSGAQLSALASVWSSLPWPATDPVAPLPF